MLGAFVEILASSVLQKLKAKQLVITCCGASASSVYEFLSRCAVQNDNYQLSRILGVVSVFPDYHPSACICDIGCLIITSSENYGAYHRCFMANPQAIVVSGDGIGIEDLDKHSGAVSLWVARTIAKYTQALRKVYLYDDIGNSSTKGGELRSSRQHLNSRL